MSLREFGPPAAPGIAYVAVFAFLALLIAAASTATLARIERLEARATHADSTARAKTLEVVILRRDVAAARAQAARGTVVTAVPFPSLRP